MVNVYDGDNVKTVITYNKGSRWRSLAAPPVGSDGQPTLCLPVSRGSPCNQEAITTVSVLSPGLLPPSPHGHRHTSRILFHQLQEIGGWSHHGSR